MYVTSYFTQVHNGVTVSEVNLLRVIRASVLIDRLSIPATKMLLLLAGCLLLVVLHCYRVTYGNMQCISLAILIRLSQFTSPQLAQIDLSVLTCC